MDNAVGALGEMLSAFLLQLFHLYLIYCDNQEI